MHSFSMLFHKKLFSLLMHMLILFTHFDIGLLVSHV